MTVDSVRLFPHQQFIVDYMQFSSPYRGILLMHHLGSGKSCSSIAAAEVLANNMKVCVMTPASLRGNYIEEIKKCGRMFYSVNQKWVFAAVKTAELDEVAKISSIDKSFLVKQKGIWVPVQEGHAFAELSDVSKKQVQEQIDNIISNRIRFINYNGLNRNKIKELTNEGTTNPFDNTCVVIDEIHNIISRVVNKRQIGNALYKLLMQAKNCKLVMLSGTPIINYPHEIAFIVNLITGPRKLYEVRVGKSIVSKEALESSKHVDRYIIDPATQKVSFELLPAGFEFTNRPHVTRVSNPRSEEEIVEEVVASLGISGKPRVTTRNGTTLPDDPEDFNRLFINSDAGTVTNQGIFAKRVLGTVSFYKTSSPELFPSVTIEDVPVQLTDFQFSVYEKSRQEERRKESKSKKNKPDQASSGQVYRFYSRANCNFVFPEDIKRPFPTSTAIMKNEIDLSEEGKDVEDVVKDMDKDDLKTKKDFIKEYHDNLNKALVTLDTNGHKYLTLEKLEALYSPKFAHIIRRLKTSPGSALVYSQFRTVEGLGILGMALKQQGWAEFKLKKTSSGELEIDVDEKDLDKPMYTMFTGNNDESKMTLKLFNGDLDTVPAALKKHKLNLRAIMITQSGAEGISLKNVRQVHVIEPYWNQIRVDQVIGRAVRTCSHIGLPKDQRNVSVYLYRSVLSKKQKENSFTLRTQDKSATSDEYIHDIAQRKANVINKLLEILQKSAIDCAINAKYHNNMRCFSFPVNMKPEMLTYEFDIANDQPLSGIVQREWNGQVLVTKKGQFLIRPETKEVYDYDLYVESGRLVKLGTITEPNAAGNRRISL